MSAAAWFRAARRRRRPARRLTMPLLFVYTTTSRRPRAFINEKDVAKHTIIDFSCRCRRHAAGRRPSTNIMGRAAAIKMMRDGKKILRRKSFDDEREAIATGDVRHAF